MFCREEFITLAGFLGATYVWLGDENCEGVSGARTAFCTDSQRPLLAGSRTATAWWQWGRVGRAGPMYCCQDGPLSSCTQGPASVSWGSSWRQGGGTLGWLMHHSWEPWKEGKGKESGEEVRE